LEKLFHMVADEFVGGFIVNRLKIAIFIQGSLYNSSLYQASINIIFPSTIAEWALAVEGLPLLPKRQQQCAQILPDGTGSGVVLL